MKNFSKTHVLVALASLAAFLGGAAIAQAASTNKGAVKNGVSWIRKSGLSQFPSGGTGFKADTLSALAAAKKIGVSVPSSTRDGILSSVEEDTSSYAITAGATAKLILAAAATGRNPRCFGPKNEESDLYNILKSFYNSSSGQYGKTSFDQALALLALKAAYQKIPSKAIGFAKSRRGQYGWNFAMSKNSGDDVESSALMIEALRSAGVSRKESGLRSAYKWITFQRNIDGGYNPDTPNGETQADATSYVIRAADTIGAGTSKAKRALRALQKKGGSFRSSPSAAGSYPTISTTNAVLALSGQHYPVVARSKAGKSCV
ncbi:MAG: hypothetical protein HYX29_03865 [Solirubrobacterales bacterium]|nr:hypothetical protein [Solirubrobacterales bacterium]